MPRADRDRNAEKYEKRDWEQIAAGWGDVVSAFADGIVWPEVEVEDLPQLRPFFDQMRQGPHHELIELDEINFIYPELFIASFAYLRRATHVLCAAIKHSDAGRRSWSRVSAYHASYFAMRAISGLLGAAILRHRARDETYQIDVWCAGPVQRKSVMFAAEAFSVKGYMRCKGRLSHFDLWSIFSRLLRATAISPAIWPYSVADRYKRVPGDAYAKLRNKLQYRASGWPFDDLIQQLAPEDIGLQCGRCVSENWTDTPDDGDFPLLLGLQIVPMALALFQSVSPAGGILRAEVDNRDVDLRNANVLRTKSLGLI
jgi:hypothetical protein